MVSVFSDGLPRVAPVGVPRVIVSVELLEVGSEAR